MTRCLECQQVKFDHHHSPGLLQPHVIDQMTQWEKNLPLVKFSYNNNYHSSIGMQPYEALYGRSCRTLLRLERLEDRVIVEPELIQEMEEKVI